MNELKNGGLTPVAERLEGLVVTAKGLESQEAVRALADVRKKIDAFADSPSREGVLSDVLGIVVVGLSQLTVGLSKAKSLAEINAAAAPLAEIGAAIDGAVKSGALKLPYMVKTGGVQGVLTDMIALSNGLTRVLSNQKPPPELAG